MKPVKILILLCGGLMATASIIGTIDLAKASKNGELRNLYKEDEQLLATISFLNTEQLRGPDPLIESFSRAPIRPQAYTESGYQAELKATNEENDKLSRYRRARAKTTFKIKNRKKIEPPPIIKLSSFSRGKLPIQTYIKSKDEDVPNDK